MCPEFFHIGPFAIRAYGVTLALSFFIGLILTNREAKVLRLDPDRTVNLGFILIIFGVIGARLGFALYHWSEFSGHLLDIINPFGHSGYFGIAGLNLQGGFLLALIAGWIYLKRKRMPFFSTLDAVVPAVAFGIFLARIGCFLNGCCFGTPTDSFLGVVFPHDSAAWYVFGNTPVHPAQLYSSAYGLFLFFLVRWFNRRHYSPGVTTGVFFVVEAGFRFAIESVRYYEPEMWIDIAGAHATFNHLIAVALFILGVLVILNARRRTRSAPPPKEPTDDSPVKSP